MFNQNFESLSMNNNSNNQFGLAQRQNIGQMQGQFGAHRGSFQMDNIQMSDINNRNPKGKEIDRLKTIAQILEEAIR